MEFTTYYSSPLGKLLLAADSKGLFGLWFEGQQHFACNLSTMCTEQENVPVLTEAKRWLDTYFGGEQPDFTPQLSMRTTAFRRRIWEMLLEIPYGETITYGELARHVARDRCSCRMSAQAIGGAVAHNSISLIIPCHRVVGANHKLTGYAGGLERKRWLLKWEGDRVFRHLE